MAIIYDKLFQKLKEKGYTTYRIRQERLISEGTLTNLRNRSRHLDGKVLDRLCRVLECQPGDLMEYVPDDQNECAQKLIRQMQSAECHMPGAAQDIEGAMQGQKEWEGHRVSCRPGEIGGNANGNENGMY